MAAALRKIASHTRLSPASAPVCAAAAIALAAVAPAFRTMTGFRASRAAASARRILSPSRDALEIERDDFGFRIVDERPQEVRDA